MAEQYEIIFYFILVIDTIPFILANNCTIKKKIYLEKKGPAKTSNTLKWNEIKCTNENSYLTGHIENNNPFAIEHATHGNTE